MGVSSLRPNSAPTIACLQMESALFWKMLQKDVSHEDRVRQSAHENGHRRDTGAARGRINLGTERKGERGEGERIQTEAMRAHDLACFKQRR